MKKSTCVMDTGTDRNDIIFGVDSSSSSHVDNHKNNFLILGLGPTLVICLLMEKKYLNLKQC